MINDEWMINDWWRGETIIYQDRLGTNAIKLTRAWLIDLAGRCTRTLRASRCPSGPRRTAQISTRKRSAHLSLSLSLSLSLLFREIFLGCLFCPEPVLATDPKTAWRGREKKTPAFHWRQCVSFFGNRRTPSFAETGSVQTLNEKFPEWTQGVAFSFIVENKTGRARGVQGALPNN